MCLHMLRATTTPNTLSCDCGKHVQILCVVCKTAVHGDAEKRRLAFKCGECPALLCHRCIFDCGRVKGAAVCDACSLANSYRFDAKSWCVSLTIFIVSATGAQNVERHILPTVFSSLSDALEAVPLYLEVAFPDLESVEKLASAAKKIACDNGRRRELVVTTDTVYTLGESARMEVHAKLLVPDCQSVVPLQAMPVQAAIENPSGNYSPSSFDAFERMKRPFN